MNERAQLTDFSPVEPGKPASSKVLPIGAAFLAVVSIFFVTGYFQQVYSAVQIPSAQAGAPQNAEADLVAPLRTATHRFLEAEVAVEIDGRKVKASWAELGMRLDEGAVARLAAHMAVRNVAPATIGAEYFAAPADNTFAPIALDRDAGFKTLLEYKNRYDREPVSAKMDLENRRVYPDEPGFGIRIYEALALVEQRAQAAQRSITLPGQLVMPTARREELKDLDISHVLGWFETRYAPGEKNRNYNLALGAEQVNGHILMPGEEFSFNEIVGDRTEKEGYHIAHVILAGEMVDGMAGGSCQISSTLHGAAFFAGLEIVKSLPHSRPSAYITMGLDATVVYPQVDLQLKNQYDFPVVFKYTVSQGTMRVEVLGRERPYDKIRFERRIVEELPFQTITRDDDTIPVGGTLVDQIGFPGYKIERRRLYFKDGEVVKRDRWKLKYPATTEYLRVGTNPDPNIPMAATGDKHGLKPPKRLIFRSDQ